MKFIGLIFSIIFCLLAHCLIAQHLGFSFNEAEKNGISIKDLDQRYKSATHADTALAVFKSDSAKEGMYNAYVKLLRDFGKFLTKNNFKWDKMTKGFNRIYFNSDGSIDYFVFNFNSPNVKEEDTINKEKQDEFATTVEYFHS